MSALDDGDFGCEPVADLAILARDRRSFYEDGVLMSLQDAERDAGLTEADIWQFAAPSTQGR